MKELNLIDILKQVFDLEAVKVSQKREGGLLSSKTVDCYHIPEHSFVRIANDFPMLKYAYKAGLVSRDRKNGVFNITSSVLEARSTDKRKLGAKQFFSIDGKDKNDRTTLFDAICTVRNVKEFCQTFLLDPKKIKYTIRHRDGNPDDVVNFMELDKNLFGDTEEDADRNIEKINRAVKFVRGGEYGSI